MFSKACEYSIKIMIYMATRFKEEKHVGLRAISQAIDSPEPFTAKILQNLVKSKLLDSVKGPNGGFKLSKPAHEISLREIVFKTDGEGIFTDCVLGFKVCSDEIPCPIHHKFKDIRMKLTQNLGTTTLDEINENILKGIGKLKY